VRDGGGPTLGGSIAFLNGASEIVFPPPEKVPNGAAGAISIWNVSSGEIVFTVDGPQPQGERALNLLEHFMVSPESVQKYLQTKASGKSWRAMRIEPKRGL
jgi:hypothetical protein